MLKGVYPGILASGDCPLPLRTGLEGVERVTINGSETAIVKNEKGLSIGKSEH